MENASKALIMAGAILIALVIISLGIIVLNNFGEKVKDTSEFTEQEIAEFNAKITPYIGANIAGSQVNALIETVRSINQRVISQGVSEGIMSITYPGTDGKTTILDKENKVSYENGSTENATKKVKTGQYYQVSVNYGNDGIINEITVKGSGDN